MSRHCQDILLDIVLANRFALSYIGHMRTLPKSPAKSSRKRAIAVRASETMLDDMAYLVAESGLSQSRIIELLLNAEVERIEKEKSQETGGRILPAAPKRR